MPILHSQYQAEGKTPDGKIIQLPAQVGLVARGPLVQVTVSLADQIASELIKQGKSHPGTGSGSCLDRHRGRLYLH